MPHEQQKLLERLLKVFTMDQLELLSTDLEAVQEHGFGGVFVEFNNHHPLSWHIWPRITKLFPKPKPMTYRAE